MSYFFRFVCSTQENEAGTQCIFFCRFSDGYHLFVGEMEKLIWSKVKLFFLFGCNFIKNFTLVELLLNFFFRLERDVRKSDHTHTSIVSLTDIGEIFHACVEAASQCQMYLTY